MKSTSFTVAITKRPSASYSNGQSSGLYGSPVLEKALMQHDDYCRALSDCGVKTVVLEPDDKFPDSTFVEDTAVLLPEAAVITRPGHPSRTGEIRDIRIVLSEYREIVEIPDEARIDGGDVLQADRDFFVGLSGRTDGKGAEAFSDIVTRFGYSCTPVAIDDCLHLKSVVNHLGDGWMIVDERYRSLAFLESYRLVSVPAEEEYAANCIRVNDTVLTPAGFPVSRTRIEEAGFRTRPIEVSEFMKMDGGLSCLSLRF